MSHSRPSTTDKTSFNYTELVKPLAHIIICGITVPTVLFPIEAWQTRIQLSSAGALPRMGLLPLLYYWGHAIKGGLMKTSVISQRDLVHENVEAKMGRNGHDETTPAISTKSKLYSTLIASAGLGIIDTSLTTYFANMRILYAKGQVLFDHLWAEKFYLAKLGFPIRYGRNIIVTFCCLGATTLVEDPVTMIMSPSCYSFASPLVSNILCGGVAGALANGIDVVYKRIVEAADVKNFQSPGVFQMTWDIWIKEGPKTFWRGAGLSMLMTSLAFMTLEASSQLTEYLFALHEAQRNKRLANQNKMFTPAGESKAFQKENEIKEWTPRGNKRSSHE